MSSIASTHQLMRTRLSAKIPDLDGPSLVARDELALVRVDDAIVDGDPSVVKDPLGVLGCAWVPDLDPPVLARGDYPLPVVLPRYCGDVALVPFEGCDLVDARRAREQEWAGVGRSGQEQQEQQE